jgi:hypothetical protein
MSDKNVRRLKLLKRRDDAILETEHEQRQVEALLVPRSDGTKSGRAVTGHDAGWSISRYGH